MNRRPTTALLFACLLIAGGGVPSVAQSPSPGAATEPPAGNPSEGDLAGQFPATLGGRDLQVTIDDGTEWMARFDTAGPDGAIVIERTKALLASVEGTVDDLTIATALHVPDEGEVATISALRVRGAEAHQIVDGAIGLMLGDVAVPALEVRISGGRDVLKVRDAEMPGAYPRTLVPVGDTLWIVQAEPPLLDEILSVLPAAPTAAAPAFDLASSVPLVLDGARRVYLVVSSGWDYVFWPTENSPSQLDAVALESFLASGITMDNVTTTSSVWTDTEGNIGAVLAAYQFAGADQDVLQGLLEDVILPRFEGLGSVHEPGQIAGRDVIVLRDETLIDSDGAPRPAYLYVSGDTIFVLDASEKTADAAIDALP